MSVQPPGYLDSIKNNIRTRVVPWDSALRVHVITPEQRDTIERVKAGVVNRKAAIEANLDRLSELFAGAGSNKVFESANTTIIQYLLVLFADLVEICPALAQSIAARKENPYQHLLPRVAPTSNPDDNVPLLAASTLCAVMAAAQDSSLHAMATLPILLEYLSGLAKHEDSNIQSCAVQQYSILLYGPKTRNKFWAQRTDTLRPLIDILRTVGDSGEGSSSSSNASFMMNNGSGPSTRNGSAHLDTDGGVGLQLLYNILLVVWQTSFEADIIGAEMNDEFDIIMLYTQLIRRSPKEKTTRLLLATLHNLLKKNPGSLPSMAVLANLPLVLETLAMRHLTDTDLIEDLEGLREILDQFAKTKTTFDAYVDEVKSGHLRATPPHRNSSFWSENARKIMEYENGALVEKLADIMSRPWDMDKTVLAIACNDVGALVREVPERRHQLDKLGIKTRIMELMGDSDENVRWESLHALGGWLKYSFGS